MKKKSKKYRKVLCVMIASAAIISGIQTNSVFAADADQLVQTESSVLNKNSLENEISSVAEVSSTISSVDAEQEELGSDEQSDESVVSETSENEVETVGISNIENADNADKLETQDVAVYADDGSARAVDDGYSAEITFENESTRGSIEITKYKDDEKTILKGVTFKLSDAEGNVVDEKTTDDKGQVLFENLMPGIYMITETKTVDGYTLLKDPIKVDLPYEMDKTQAQEDGVDITKAAEYKEKLYFFNLKYDVANDVTLNLPMTGFFDHWTNYIWIAVALLLIATGVVAANLKKKPIPDKKGTEE